MPLTIRMICDEILSMGDGKGRVSMVPVAPTEPAPDSPDAAPENRVWAEGAPGGRLEIAITVGDVLTGFVSGKEFLLTIEPAPEGG